VSILLGNGDGTFQAHSDLGVGGEPEGVALGDFNGDGKMDLAVVNAGPSTVSILLNNGDGTFGGSAPIALQQSKFSSYSGIQVADFNGDGKLDLAVTGWNSQLAVLLGNGDGTFHAPAYYGEGGSSLSAVADFNSDGFLDVATGNGTGVLLYLGNGDGSFQDPLQYATGYSLLLPLRQEIFDQKPDLAVANGGSSGGGNTLTVLLNTGQVEFSFVLMASPGTQIVTVGNSVSFTVTGTTENGFNSPVLLTCSGQPTGATCTLNPTTVTPTMAGVSSTMTVTTSTSTPAGSYSLVVTGTSGSEQFSVTPSLTVNPVPPDFSLSAPSSTTPSSGNAGSVSDCRCDTGIVRGIQRYSCTYMCGLPDSDVGAYVLVESATGRGDGWRIANLNTDSQHDATIGA
jgi:hypothetical protein